VVSSGERAAFVSITPCRLFDMRPAPDLVGARSTPLAQTETYTQQVTGSNGNCVIPADATGVAMNVTTVGGTDSSFLTIWPADATRPLASNLNWVAGAAPTPNKVDVKLSSDGKINLFNNAGSVFVLADVVGYYADHDHDDRYYTRAQSDTQFAGKANAADVYTKTQVNSFPANSIVAGGGVAREGFALANVPQFGSTWTVSKLGTGIYSISLPGLNPGCTSFPLVMLTAFDEPGRIMDYYSAGTSCASGDTSLDIRTTDADGVLADTRFQFLAFRPGAGQIVPTGATGTANEHQIAVDTPHTRCTMTRDGTVSCS
jgi:hypothetical protein